MPILLCICIESRSILFMQCPSLEDFCGVVVDNQKYEGETQKFFRSCPCLELFGTDTKFKPKDFGKNHADWY